jgi:hypothetical protein
VGQKAPARRHHLPSGRPAGHSSGGLPERGQPTPAFRPRKSPPSGQSGEIAAGEDRGELMAKKSTHRRHVRRPPVGCESWEVPELGQRSRPLFIICSPLPAAIRPSSGPGPRTRSSASPSSRPARPPHRAHKKGTHRRPLATRATGGVGNPGVPGAPGNLPDRLSPPARPGCAVACTTRGGSRRRTRKPRLARPSHTELVPPCKEPSGRLERTPVSWEGFSRPGSRDAAPSGRGTPPACGRQQGASRGALGRLACPIQPTVRQLRCSLEHAEAPWAGQSRAVRLCRQRSRA